jgi:hypothetical protein
MNLATVLILLLLLAGCKGNSHGRLAILYNVYKAEPLSILSPAY